MTESSQPPQDTTSQQQTSVFISQPNGGFNGEHKSPSDTLLSPSASMKSPRPSGYRGTPRRWKILLALCIFATLLVVAIVLLITLRREPTPEFSQPSKQINKLDSFCVNRTKPIPIEVTYGIHERCSSIVNVTSECVSGNETFWKLLTPTTKDWGNTLAMLGADHNQTKSLLVSPLFTLPPQTCSLHISYNFAPSQTLYYVTENNATLIPAQYTSQSGCQYVTEGRFRPGVAFSLAIASETNAPAPVTRFTMTSQACVGFSNIETMASVSRPNFTRVGKAERNFCSFGLLEKVFVCDWFGVRGLVDLGFKRREEHHCPVAGVSLQDGGFFVTFTPQENPSRALMVSPVVQGGIGDVIFSFWHVMFCEGFGVRVWVVPYDQGRPLFWMGSVGRGDLVFEMNNTGRNDYRWANTVVRINTTKFTQFQILIEASGSVNGSCGEHLECGQPGDNNKPKSPILALDDLLIESLDEPCNVTIPGTNSSSVLDCYFQDSTGSGTTCLWQKKGGDEPTAPEIPIFPGYESTELGWASVDSVYYDDTTDHGPLPKHFKGRGYILLLDGSGVLEASVFTSFLAANKPCSCRISFMYLLRGAASPRIKLSLLTGPESDTKRPARILWSLHGHRGPDWLQASVPLNLRPGVNFQLEFKAEEFADSRGEAALDDVVFHDCDLRLAVSHNSTMV